jgi:hypothetical protein
MDENEEFHRHCDYCDTCLLKKVIYPFETGAIFTEATQIKKEIYWLCNSCFIKSCFIKSSRSIK